MEEHRREIKSYVLRAGRMSKGQKLAYEKYSKLHCIEFSGEPLELNVLFDGKDVCIEIGFGMGTATAEIAANNPDKGYLAIEVHRPGVGRLLSAIEERGLENIKIINFDAVQVLKDMIPDASVSGFHIFFPDPWPKKKHHKRRLINTEFTSLLTDKLKQNGYIYAVTDWEDYAEQMLRVLSSNDRLVNSYRKWADPPDWRPETAFERKGLVKNHVIRELYFKRL